MKKVLILFIIGIFLIITSCSNRNKKEATDVQGDLKGNISISGAFAIYPLTVRWAEEFEKLHPGINFDISAGGAGKGMTDVLSGMVDLAMFSREVSPEEEQKGAWKIAGAKDAVLPTINANNPYLQEIQSRGITTEEFKNIFLEETEKAWDIFIPASPNKKINVYTRSDACGAAAMWAQYLGKNQEDLFGIGVFGDPGMADAVKNDVWGLGYNNVIYIYDIKTRKKYENLEVIPIDQDESGTIEKEEDFYDSLDNIMHAIKDGHYPSPPARVLYLISKGKPENKNILEFLKFVVTDGQKYVHEAGYVQIDSTILTKELNRLQ